MRGLEDRALAAALATRRDPGRKKRSISDKSNERQQESRRRNEIEERGAGWASKLATRRWDARC